MKFGKRLNEEAARRWPEAYIDYKGLKHAINQDVAVFGPKTGQAFRAALEEELVKASAFYVNYESQLLCRAEVSEGLSQPNPQALGPLRADALDLRKCAVLNQMAVTKAVKKARRRLPGGAGAGLDAGVILASQPFFASARLAHLLTRLEVRAARGGPSPADPGYGALPRSRAAAREPADFVCPICLDLLRSPVVLNCAHRFCWACLLSHAQHAARYGDVEERAAIICSDAGGAGRTDAAGGAGTAASPGADAPGGIWTPDPTNGKKRAAAPGTDGPQASIHAQDAGGPPGTVAAACPVCRQSHFLDLERLEVDAVLEAFVRLLRRGKEGGDGVEEEEEEEEEEEARERAGDTGGRPPRPAARAVAIPAGAAGRWAGPVPPPSTPPRRPSLGAIDDDTGFDPVLPSFSPAAPPPVVVGAVPGPALAGPPPTPDTADAPAPDAPLLPPLDPGAPPARLVVCLDLDGTLVTTFSPARVPILPRGAVAYSVGRGSRLNPSGVVVVERPGLGEFLARCARCAEVVLFTAGLAEYAVPICDELEARYPACFHHRLYRPATVPSADYPCVKDLARLGRPLGRTVLVDDTPLAFSFQPDNGIPVLQFRGDVDDRLLNEALAPLIETLAAAHDVRSVLHARFNMRAWFAAQRRGKPVERGAGPPRPGRARDGARDAGARRGASPAAPTRPRSAASSASLAARPDAPPPPSPAWALKPGPLLICDFDQTLLAVDAGEALCESLAPELTSLLSVADPAASWIPATNAVWREAARRGVTREELAAALRALGRDMPAPSVRLLGWAAARGWATHILSDCNAAVVAGVLGAAGVAAAVDGVTTNPSTLLDARDGLLQVQPLHHAAGADGDQLGASAAPPRCPRCPPNLCKGRELERLVGERDAARRAHGAAGPAPPVVYVGDGCNDLCPALRLGAQDCVLARAGFPLDALLAERERGEGVRARVLRWQTHDDLLRLVQALEL